MCWPSGHSSESVIAGVLVELVVEAVVACLEEEGQAVDVLARIGRCGRTGAPALLRAHRPPAKRPALGGPWPLPSPGCGDRVVTFATAGETLPEADRAALDVAAATVRLANRRAAIGAADKHRAALQLALAVPDPILLARRLRGTPRRARAPARAVRLGQERPAERVNEEPFGPLRRRPRAEARAGAVAQDVSDYRLAAVGLADYQHQDLNRRVFVVPPGGQHEAEAIGLLSPDALREDHRRQVLLVELVYPFDGAHVSEHEAPLRDVEDQDAGPGGLGVDKAGDAMRFGAGKRGAAPGEKVDATKPSRLGAPSERS